MGMRLHWVYLVTQRSRGRQSHISLDISEKLFLACVVCHILPRLFLLTVEVSLRTQQDSDEEVVCLAFVGRANAKHASTAIKWHL